MFKFFLLSAVSYVVQVPLVLLLASTGLANLLTGHAATGQDRQSAHHHGHGVEEGGQHGAVGAGQSENLINVQHHRLPKGPRRTVLHRNGRKVGEMRKG